MRLLVRQDGSVKKVRVLIGLPNGLTEAAVKNAYSLLFQRAPAINSISGEAWTPYEATIQNSPRIF